VGKVGGKNKKKAVSGNILVTVIDMTSYWKYEHGF